MLVNQLLNQFKSNTLCFLTAVRVLDLNWFSIWLTCNNTCNVHGRKFKKHKDSLADVYTPLFINLTATVARGTKGTAHGSSAASQALDIEGDMMSLADWAGDMLLDIKLRYCIEIAEKCWQKLNQAITKPISAAADSNHPSHTSKQSAQKEYHNGVDVCRKFCRGHCKSSNCKFAHPPGRGGSAFRTAVGRK